MIYKTDKGFIRLIQIHEIHKIDKRFMRLIRLTKL